ncbi:MAG: DNA adenine methylase [Bacteroidales bacterium]|nr:DNA adenine methylase [Bacteroidales bacterium]
MVMRDTTPKNQRFSVYIEEEVLNFLRGYYCEKAYISDALTIRCCAFDVLHNAVTDWTLQNTEKIFYMVGQKNPEMLDFLNDCFDDIRSVYRIDGYAEPFTGTANVLLHAAEADAEFINDNSTDLVNLLRVIRDYAYELKVMLIKLSVNTQTFNSLNVKLQEHFCLKSSKSARIQRAVAFFFCRYITHYGAGTSYNGVSPASYLKKLDSIYSLSQRLQGVDIKKRDALYFAKVLMEDAETYLIYFDAPYICSEEYYKKNNAKHTAFSAHTALRNRVLELRQRHICVLSYRITSSESMKKRGINDETLQKKLDRLYLNRGFHYRLKPLKRTNEQVEILIATVPFTGSRPYTDPLAETEVM